MPNPIQIVRELNFLVQETIIALGGYNSPAAQFMIARERDSYKTQGQMQRELRGELKGITAALGKFQLENGSAANTMLESLRAVFDPQRVSDVTVIRYALEPDQREELPAVAGVIKQLRESCNNQQIEEYLAANVDYLEYIADKITVCYDKECANQKAYKEKTARADWKSSTAAVESEGVSHRS